MKKQFKILFALLIVLVLSFSFVACNSDKDGTDGGTNGANFKTAEEIASAFSNGQLTIKYNTSNGSNDYYTVTQTEQGCFYSSYRTPKDILDGTLFLKSENGYKMYDITDGERTFEMAYESDSVADMFVGNIFSTYLTAYSSLDANSFNNKGSTTVANRECTKYEYSYSGLGASVKYEYCIDNQTGICLKFVGSAGSGGDSATASFEVIELILGNASLKKYTDLPCDETGGTTIGGSTTWPSSNIVSLAPFFDANTVPALVGAAKFSYMKVDGLAMVIAEGISQAEYDSYVDLLKTNGYTITTDLYLGPTATKSLSNGNALSISLVYSADDSEDNGELTLSITPIYACEADIVLPENFKITYVLDNTVYTVIKIGNDFYKEYTDAYESTTKTFAKFDAQAKKWSAYTNDANTNGWELNGTEYSTTNSLLNDFLDNIYFDIVLSKNDHSLAGTEKVAGVDCNKFVYSDEYETITYYKSYDNFVFKKVSTYDGENTTNYEVQSYTTTVSAFPSMPN